MEEVERINAAIVYLIQQARFVPQNPYTIDIDRGNRNCYNCKSFGHWARNCRNRGIRDRIGKDKRLKYRGNVQETENNRQNNLNGKRDLIILNQVLVAITDLQYLVEQ